MSSDDSPKEVARAFVQAVAWGEHLRVWEMLGDEGKKTVLRVAVKRGMNDALAARLGAGTASTEESDTFLTDLINGLRADMAGTDLDALRYWFDAEAAEEDRAWVVLMAPLPAELGGELPMGSVELTRPDGSWRVERFSGRPSRPREDKGEPSSTLGR
jgi:hypothetical protein